MSISDKLTTIAENEQKVYNAGYEAGKAEGGGNDNFWELFQDGGSRTTYSYAFRNEYWTNELFKPKYKMYPTYTTYMLYASAIDDPQKIVDYFDFSNCTGFNSTFALTNFERLPELNLTSVTTAASAFQGMGKLTTIDKLIINSDGSFPFQDNTFSSDTNLVEIRFEGVIGQSIALRWSTKLSKRSIENIFDCLSDTATGQSVNLAQNAVNRAFETSTGAQDGISSEEWAVLVATKPNWTVNLT